MRNMEGTDYSKAYKQKSLIFSRNLLAYKLWVGLAYTNLLTVMPMEL